jgi:serine/threonine-protein kinase RsbW
VEGVQQRVPATKEWVPKLRHAVLGFLSANHPNAAHVAGDVGLALTEAASNVVRHAYPGRDRGEIRLDMYVHGDQLVVAVSDDGVGFAHPADDPGGGFGLPLMRELAHTEIRSEAGQTRVEMRFPIPRSQAPRTSLTPHLTRR